MKQSILVFAMIVCAFQLKAQSNKNPVWGELTLESTAGLGLYVNHNELIYGFSYNTSLELLSEFKYDVNRIDVGVQRYLPINSKKLDFTAGLGAGYVFGVHNFGERYGTLIGTGFSEEEDVNTLIGIVNAKINGNFSKHFGIGFGVNAMFGNNYTQVMPNMRILVGGLKNTDIAY